MMQNWKRAFALCVVVGLAISAGPACKKGSDWSALEKNEVKPNLQNIFDGAKGYFEKNAVVNRSGEVKPWSFPATAPLTPAKACHKGKKGLCQRFHWEHPSWGVTGFEISDPHRFQYRFLSSGSGLKARFVVRALAWDPKTKAWVVFERRATVSSEYRVVGSEKLWSDKKVRDLKKLDTPAHLGFALDSQAVTDCKAFGFIPQRTGGVIVFKARRALPVAGKGAAYCKQVWKKACGEADFAKRHVKPCKLAAK